MSQELVSRVLSISYGRKMLPLEDVYTGILVDELKNVILHDDWKRFISPPPSKIHKCEISNIFVMHDVPSKIAEFTSLAIKELYECREK